MLWLSINLIKFEMEGDNETNFEIKEEDITIKEEDLEYFSDHKADVIVPEKINEKTTDLNYLQDESNSSSNSSFDGDIESSQSMHQCQFCDFKTKYRGNLKQHQNSKHLGKIDLCQFCGKEYRDRSNLNRHIRIRHLFKRKCGKTSLGLKLHNCIYCDFSSTRKENLRTHMNSLHTLENIFSCVICDYVGTRIDSYRRHMQAIHGEKEKHYKCSRCSFKTLRRDDFDSHFKDNHAEYQNFPCKSCDYRATFACNLKRHIQRKHS